MSVKPPTTFSDKNLHVIPVLNSLYRIKKPSNISFSKPQKHLEVSLDKNQNNTINVNKSKNFLIKDGKLVLDPKKADVLNEYLSCTNSNRPDFQFFMKNYLTNLKGSQQNMKKNLSDKKIALLNRSDKTYRFAPSFNQFYQETKNKYHNVLSNLQFKSTLRNSLNKQKNNNMKLDLKKNHYKLNSLLSIQKEKINEKTSFYIEKRVQTTTNNDFNKKNDKKIKISSENENLIQKLQNDKFSKSPLIFKNKKLQKEVLFERNRSGSTADKLISPLKLNEYEDNFHYAGDDDEDLDYYVRHAYFKNK